MNRQLSVVYDLFESIRSMLGEYGVRGVFPKINFTPLNSQNPVQRSAAHALDRSYGLLNLVHRYFADDNNNRQGVSRRDR